MSNDKKKPTYEEILHELDSSMLQASSLKGEQTQQEFVTTTFVAIHNRYKGKQVNHEGYVKLINRLARYQGGVFNDYIDTLAGSAQVGMLEIAVQQSKKHNLAEASRQRSQTVTDLTGVQPVKPDTEQE